MATRSYPWQALFPPAPTGMEMQVIRKRGHPFLALPTERRLALQSLSLYPGQTRLAQWGKRVLSCLLSLGLPLPLERMRLPLAQDNPLIRFLNSREGTPFSGLTILAGNPFVAGQRFIILTFGPDREPGYIIKIGTDPHAIRLIRSEEHFLATAGDKVPSVIRLHSVYEGPGCHGLAFRYISGVPPQIDDVEEAGRTLSLWNTGQPRRPLSDIPAWERLRNAIAGQAAARREISALLTRLGPHAVTPVLVHGDFVPWNIRQTPDGGWTVLDWERGEPTGTPGWDWFHYVVHTQLLVAKADPALVCDRLEDLLALPLFEEYARATGIREIQRPLLGVYLEYCLRVLRLEERTARKIRQISRLWKETYS